jgi:hypothetical protein
MMRIILSIEEQEKSWLERKAREDGVSMSEVVRKAVQRMREADQGKLDRILKATSGIWRGGDGLRYQRKIRREWR